MNVKARSIPSAAKILLLLSLYSFVITECQHTKSSREDCPTWHFYNSSTNHCQCYQDNALNEDLHCEETGDVCIGIGNCMTYEERTGSTYFAKCVYFQLGHGNISDGSRLSLPRNVSELNEYMCGPMKREGLVCSQCVDNYGPSLTSVGYKCVECSGLWYGILMYVVVCLGPITIFYFVVFIFRISLVSAPMTCFILYSQIVLLSLFKDPVIINTWIIQSNRSKEVELLIKVIGVFFGIWNLDFLVHILPPICISSRIGIFHIEMLSFFSALYSFILIAITWICIELHDRNFKPLVITRRIFSRCFSRLIKPCDTKRDIVDFFATFLYLSYSKLTFYSLWIFIYQSIVKDGVSYQRVSVYDPSIPYMGAKHRPFVVLAVCVLLILVIPPPLILLLYPTKAFSACLVKLRLNGRPNIAVKAFVDKYYACYKDTVNCDKRSFSSLYFFLRYLLMAMYVLRTTHVSNNMWIYTVVLFASVAILTAYVKPYKKTYMNVCDTLLLSLMALISLLLSMHIKSPVSTLIEVVLTLLPAVVFLGAFIIWKSKILTPFKKCLLKLRNVKGTCSATTGGLAEEQTHEAQEHLIEPKLIASNDMSYYGSM